MRTPLAVLLLALAAPLTVLVAPSEAEAPTRERVTTTTAPPSGHTTTAPAPRGVPALRVTTLVGGLSHPWDVQPLPSGALLVTERSPARLSVVRGERRSTVRFPAQRVWQSGETGLMGLAVDPGFSRNHRIYTCSGWNLPGGRHDVRVNAWRLTDHARRARLIGPLVTGFPTTSGRHGGCRLLLARDGSLYVGTGDAATGTNPESLTSLGGKTLRLDPRTGRPWPTNPFAQASNRAKRYVHTYGHRNVQGLAQRRDGTIWSVEQGTYRDDEVNLLRNGGDYGYNPVPGYDESVPMTDQSLPGPQVAARWRSGPATVAASGAGWVSGRRWGALDGTLAVAALKDEEVLFLTFDRRGRLQRVTTPAALKGIARLRTVVPLPDGSLVVPTDDDGPNGRLLLVRPR